MAKRDIEAGASFVRLFLKDDMRKALARTLKNSEKALKNFGDAMTNLGSRLAAAGTATLAPFALSLRTFASFDDQMRVVQAVTGSTGAQFDALTARAKELGASTSFTALQVAALMVQLGRAGFASDQVNEMTGAVLSLARSTGSDAAEAAGILSAAIRQFGLDAEDAARVADTLTAGANKSFNTLETIGESLKFAGPVARDFNLSLEETVAILGTLGNVGIQASLAGTAVRRLLTATGAEAERLQGIFGVSFVDAAGNARPLVDTLQEVADATAGPGTAARAEKFEEAFGLRGITGASAISNTITGTRDLMREIEGAGGIAEETAAKMDAGLGGSLRILISAVEGVKIAIGDQLAPILLPLIDQLTSVTRRSIDWIRNNRELVGSIAVVGAVVLAAGGALTAIGLTAQFAAFTLGGLTAAATFLAGIIGTIASPIGLATIALTAGIAAWAKYTESGKAAVAAVSSSFGELAQLAKDTIGGVFDAVAAGDLKLAGEIAFLGLQVAAAKGLALLEALVGNTVTSIAGRILQGDIAGAWTDATKQLGLVWAAFSENVVNVFTTAAKGVIDVWAKATGFIAQKLIELGSQPIFAKAFELLTGVNLVEEQARRDALNARLGLGREDITAEAQGLAVEQIESQQQAMNEGLDAVNASAAARTRAAAEDAVAATNAGISAIAKMAEEKTRELDLKRAEAAAKAADEEKKAKEKEKPDEPTSGQGPATRTPSGGGVVGDLVTFSAAAAVAASVGSGVNPQLDELKRIRAENEKATELAKTVADETAKATAAMVSLRAALTYPG